MAESWHTAAIALGSNLGDKKAYLEGALSSIKNNLHFRSVRVSDFIETEPYGGVEQDNFLNGALVCQTDLDPHQLLDYLHLLEQAAHRQRLVHWGPRTLDLDILLYDDLILNDEDLIIPHMEMHKRDFVLAPLSQIAPDFVHPVLKKTVSQLLASLKN